MNWLQLVGVVALAVILATKANAEVIDLPLDELAKESVLPIFDRPVSVRNRLVVTEGRIDLNLAYGMALSEPIFNVSRFSLSGYYHTSEDHAFGLIFAKNSTGLSSYASQLKEQFFLDFKRAPAPDQALMFDWNLKMFYGKMSLTKDTVFNLSLHSTVAAGLVKYSHKSYPAIAPGIGQKFYFSPNVALRFDMRLYMHQAPIPFLDGYLKDPPTGTADPIPQHDQFAERLTYTTVLDAGLTVLF